MNIIFASSSFSVTSLTNFQVEYPKKHSCLPCSVLVPRSTFLTAITQRSDTRYELRREKKAVNMGEIEGSSLGLFFIKI